MATAQFRTLKEFYPDFESVKVYPERVQLYFEANEVPEDKQVPILLSSIGSSTYMLLSDLLAPAVPKSKTLAEISVVVWRHYEPKRAVIAERFHFHKHDQAIGECIAEYNTALCRLATHCKFKGYLEDALCNRFVCGLRNKAMQQWLFGEAELTYSKAMELAEAIEAGEKTACSFKGTEPAIRKVQGRPIYHGKTEPTGLVVMAVQHHQTGQFQASLRHCHLPNVLIHRTSFFAAVTASFHIYSSHVDMAETQLNCVKCWAQFLFLPFSATSSFRICNIHAIHKA